MPAEPPRPRPIEPAVGADWTATVAAWLAARHQRVVPLIALGALLRDTPRRNRPAAADAMLAVLEQLATARLIVVVHRLNTAVGVLDRDGLRTVATSPQPPSIGQ